MRLAFSARLRVEHTIWVDVHPDGWSGYDYKGNVIEESINKFKSTCVYILRKEAKDRKYWAIAEIIHPDRRDPKRKPMKPKWPK